MLTDLKTCSFSHMAFLMFCSEGSALWNAFRQYINQYVEGWVSVLTSQHALAWSARWEEG